MRVVRILLVAAALIGTTVFPTQIARAEFVNSAPDQGRAFEIELDPTSRPAYAAINTPSYQTRSPGGMWIDTWVPQQKPGGPEPLTKWPTIIAFTPYQLAGQARGHQNIFRKLLVPYGYAVSLVHVAGSGNSPGCLDRHGLVDALTLSEAVEYISGAPWSDGRLGAAGHSYSGGTALNVVARGSDAARDPQTGLRAIFVGAPHLSDYQTQWTFDGVRSIAIAPLHVAFFMRYPSTLPVRTEASGVTLPAVDSGHTYECQAKAAAAAADPQANFSDYYQEREIGRFAKQIDTPVMTSHGHADLVPLGGVPPMVQAGFFDQLPDSTFKVGVFGTFNHQIPSALEFIRTEWTRPDFEQMLVAWFDHWVKGLQTNVKDWPTVQVQGSDGQWRAEPNWPTTGGPVGQLSLGPGGTLGTTTPTGQSLYIEKPGTEGADVEPTKLVFETPVLDQRLELTGQPVADLWVKLDRPDAHIAALLEVVDAEGRSLETADSIGFKAGWTYGLRSVQHLRPLVGNLFTQSEPDLAPILQPIRVPIRFQPTDLVVPVGAKLRLTISGSVKVNPGLRQTNGSLPDDPLLGYSQPSGATTTVQILHDCTPDPATGDPMVSTLRFLMPRDVPDLLNVEEKDETKDAGGHVVTNFAEPADSTGGGIAIAPVCGRDPDRIEHVIPSLGPEIRYDAPNWEPLAMLDVSPREIRGNDRLYIEATLRDYDGAQDLVDATLSITEKHGKPIADWHLNDFSPDGAYGLRLSINDFDLKGPWPWVVTLQTRDSSGDSDQVSQTINRTDGAE